MRTIFSVALAAATYSAVVEAQQTLESIVPEENAYYVGDHYVTGHAYPYTTTAHAAYYTPVAAVPTHHRTKATYEARGIPAGVPMQPAYMSLDSRPEVNQYPLHHEAEHFDGVSAQEDPNAFVTHTAYATAPADYDLYNRFTRMQTYSPRNLRYYDDPTFLGQEHLGYNRFDTHYYDPLLAQQRLRYPNYRHRYSNPVAPAAPPAPAGGAGASGGGGLMHDAGAAAWGAIPAPTTQNLEHACWRLSEERPGRMQITSCQGTEELIGSYCYSACAANQVGVKGWCYAKCPEDTAGAKIGSYCKMGANKQCPPNTKSSKMGSMLGCKRDYTKRTYHKAACPGEMVKSRRGLFCFDPCPNDGWGFRNSCWKKCPAGYRPCATILCLNPQDQNTKCRSLFFDVGERIKKSVDDCQNADDDMAKIGAALSGIWNWMSQYYGMKYCQENHSGEGGAGFLPVLNEDTLQQAEATTCPPTAGGAASPSHGAAASPSHGAAASPSHGAAATPTAHGGAATPTAHGGASSSSGHTNYINPDFNFAFPGDEYLWV